VFLAVSLHEEPQKILAIFSKIRPENLPKNQKIQKSRKAGASLFFYLFVALLAPRSSLSLKATSRQETRAAMKGPTQWLKRPTQARAKSNAFLL
jgi:hypothetical protein